MECRSLKLQLVPRPAQVDGGAFPEFLVPCGSRAEAF